MSYDKRDYKNFSDSDDAPVEHIDWTKSQYDSDPERQPSNGMTMPIEAGFFMWTVPCTQEMLAYVRENSLTLLEKCDAETLADFADQQRL